MVSVPVRGMEYNLANAAELATQGTVSVPVRGMEYNFIAYCFHG